MDWTHEEKSAVWWKAREVPGVDGTQWRKDVCGAWIGWRFYGDRNAVYGWEIDHIDPRGGRWDQQSPAVALGKQCSQERWQTGLRRNR